MQLNKGNLHVMCDGALIDRATAPANMIADLNNIASAGIFDSLRGGDLKAITGTGPWAAMGRDRGRSGWAAAAAAGSGGGGVTVNDDDFAEFRQQAPRWGAPVGPGAAPPREIHREDQPPAAGKGSGALDYEPSAKRAFSGSRWNDDDD